MERVTRSVSGFFLTCPIHPDAFQLFVKAVWSRDLRQAYTISKANEEVDIILLRHNTTPTRANSGLSSE